MEELKEEHDDVHVQDHSSHDVVINAKFMSSTSYNKLGVNENVESVDDDKEASNEWDVSLSEGENKHGKQRENHLNAKDNQKSNADEWSAKLCEVCLCEASVDAQSYGDCGSEASSQDNDFSWIVRADPPKKEGPAQGKDAQKDVVGRRFSCNFSTTGKSTEYCCLEHHAWDSKIPQIHYSLIDCGGRFDDSNKSESDQELSHEDEVDLPNEAQSCLIISLL